MPGAVPETFVYGVTLKPTGYLTSTAKIRDFDSGLLIEDGFVKPDATTVLNLGGYWDISTLTLGASYKPLTFPKA